MVRQVQEARKSSGLEVSDRITLRWSASGDARAAIEEHAEVIAAEVLAIEISEDGGLGAGAPGVFSDPDSGVSFAIARSEVAGA
jgi:isoleucyl-tRNA synthetase